MFLNADLFFVPGYFENDLCGFVGDLYFVHWIWTGVGYCKSLFFTTKDLFTLALSIADFRHVDNLSASEHWATGGAYVMVICDITNSRIGAGLIDREAILIFFHSKNFEIHDVKQSKNINQHPKIIPRHPNIKG